MKKILSLALAALMIVGCLAAFASCGKTETPATQGDTQSGTDQTPDTTTETKAVKVIDIPLTVEEYAFAVQKGDDTLLAQINAFLAKIKADGTFDAIVDKYFGNGTPTAVKSASTMKTDGSQLIVATNAAFEPFEYMSGVNYYGIDMEIMDLFAKEIGKELYINNMEFSAVCLSVSAAGGTYEDDNGNEISVAGGTCNIAAAGLTVNDTRKQILDFSDSYYNASQMLIVAGDDTTFDACTTAEEIEAILNGFDKSVKVGVQTGTTGNLYCTGDEDWGFAGYQFTTVGYANGALAVQNILNKNVKYVVIDEGPAKAIVANINEVN